MKKSLLCLVLMTAALSATAQKKANDALLLDMYQNQHYAEAAEYIKSVYPEPITDPKVLSRLAYTYQMAGKIPNALSVYQRIYDQDSTNVGVLFNLANIYLKRDNNVKALTYYQKITRIDSLNFSVYKQLGSLYAAIPDTLNAVKNLQEANHINPTDADVASELGALYIFQKKGKEADVVLQRALAADSTNIALLRMLVKLNYTMNRYAQTIKVCQSLQSLGDSSSYVFDKMGSSYFGLKNYECTIESFIKIPDLHQTERTYYLTAVSFKKLKDYPKAVEYFSKTLSVSISPDVNSYYFEMADTYQLGHHLKNAVTNYQKSLFFTETPLVLYILANLYDEQLIDKKNAIKYYKKYLETKPPANQQTYLTYAQSRIKVLISH